MKKYLVFAFRGLGILLLVLCLSWVVFYIYCWWKGNRDLEAARAELRALHLPMQLSEIIPPPVPDEENAAFILNCTLVPTPRTKALFRSNIPHVSLKEDNLKTKTTTPRNVGLTRVEDVSKTDLQAYQDFVQQNEPVFSLITKALGKPVYRQPINYDGGPGERMPHLSHIRSYARLLSYRAIIQETEGKPKEAIQTLLSIESLSRFLDSEPILISFLVQIALDSLCDNKLAPLITSGKLDDQTLRLIQEKIGQRNYQANHKNSLNTERIMGMDWLFDYIIHKKFSAKEMSGFSGLFDANDAKRSKLNFFRYRFYPGNYFKSDWAVSLQCFARKARHLQKSVINPAEIKLPPLPNDAFFSKFFLPALDKIHIHTGRAESIQKLVVLACALERAKLSGEVYPSELNLLCPKYIAEIPWDPFSGEKPIYRTDGKHYLLYYKGDDLKDDGGMFQKFQDIGLATDKSWLPAAALKD